MRREPQWKVEIHINAPVAKVWDAIEDLTLKGWCVERVVENVPNRRMSVTFPEDSWGMSQMFDDFLTDLVVEPREGNTTLVELQAYYVPRGFKVRAMNVLLMRRMMCKRARLTLQGLKRLLEGQR